MIWDFWVNAPSILHMANVAVGSCGNMIVGNLHIVGWWEGFHYIYSASGGALNFSSTHLLMNYTTIIPHLSLNHTASYTQHLVLRPVNTMGILFNTILMQETNLLRSTSSNFSTTWLQLPILTIDARAGLAAHFALQSMKTVNSLQSVVFVMPRSMMCLPPNECL